MIERHFVSKERSSERCIAPEGRCPEPEIKQITNETKEEMKKISQQKKQRLSSALIIKIPASNSYYNSVNIAVGRQRSGKTHSIIQEIINIIKFVQIHTC